MSAATSKPVFALDIGPLAERHHTGIANVTKHLAIELLGDAEVEPVCTFNRQVIPRAVVEKLVTDSGGDILWWLAGRTASAPMPADQLDRRVVGIYPAHKWHRRYFPFEVQVVHDLTTVLLPQYHTAETVEFWDGKLFGDMASSDLIAAVSNSTAQDIRTYFPQLKHIPVVVAPLAACARPLAPAAPSRLTPEPYVVVLGTLEPRKNILPVLEHLAGNPALLAEAAFVFIGRAGWGEAVGEAITRLGLQPWVEQGRLRFTGFVGDAVRDHLVAQARGVIYPSLYEGFGLPVLEALSFGVPVVTTTNSSLPEVGETLVTYCDFTDRADLARALAGLLDERITPAERAAAAAARRAWAAARSWGTTWRLIRDAALEILETRDPAEAAWPLAAAAAR